MNYVYSAIGNNPRDIVFVVVAVVACATLIRLINKWTKEDI